MFKCQDHAEEECPHKYRRGFDEEDSSFYVVEDGVHVGNYITAPLRGIHPVVKKKVGLLRALKAFNDN